MSATNKETVQKINQSFREGNLEAFLECCADDVRWNMADSGVQVGKDAIRKMMDMGDMEPPQIMEGHIIAEGDLVACDGTMSMKKKSGGEESHYAYCDVYTFRDGKVAEFTSYVVTLKSPA